MIKPIFKTKLEKEKKDYGCFSLEPLEKGFAHTLGNALRRCLLGSFRGAAITHIKIDGVKHQFSTLPGLKEDIVELILNLKQICIDYKDNKEIKATLAVRGPKEVKAGDIKLPANAKIVNPELTLGTLANKKSKLKMTLWINRGYGYSPAEERKFETLGIISIDANFSPVRRVNYKVETTRVGRRTDYDKLILEIWTNGTIKVKEVLEEAAKILSRYFKQIYNPVFDKDEETETFDSAKNEVLAITIEELDLPTRLINSLHRAKYKTVGDLIKAGTKKLIKIKNLGKKSIELITKSLKERGISLK